MNKVATCDAREDVPVQVIILMGVSGAGKTTVGQILADRLSWKFYDADDFHSEENKRKMNSAIPLTDEDRVAWLDSLSSHIASCMDNKNPIVLACSALRKIHRNKLAGSRDGIFFVYLSGDMELIKGRLLLRKNHYMSPDLLPSQFSALEEPCENEALHVDISSEPEEIADCIIDNMKSNLVIEFS
jgi:carbohydrate kinase (thermoresistant glucokinase family)